MINNDTATKPVQPQYLYITAITNSNPMVVSVTAIHTYVVNQLIHFSIPASFGMRQLDQMTGKIISINGLNITTNIDSTQFDIFAFPNFNKTPAPKAYATLTSAGQQNSYDETNIPFQ
jgi:hypothetical protein